MKKLVIGLVAVFVLTACASTNPPSAPSVKNSSWEYVITNPAQLKSL